MMKKYDCCLNKPSRWFYYIDLFYPKFYFFLSILIYRLYLYNLQKNFIP